MSLRSKVVGTLLGVFVLYVLAAWVVLALIHTPAFDSLERRNASDQLRRVHEFIVTESADVDLLVTDWALWDDAMLFARGENDEFYDDNLADGYLGDLGMDFGAILDSGGQQIWAEAFFADEADLAFDDLFPKGISQHRVLLRPTDIDDHVSGFIDTTQGPAIVSSAAILWDNGEGPSGGHIISGKLLDASRMESIGHTVLSRVDLLSIDPQLIPAEYLSALQELSTNDMPYSIVKKDDHLSSLKLLQDVEGQSIALLRVRNEADISKLGEHTLRITIAMLVAAALLLTLTLWLALKGMLLGPIEHLTAVLRGEDEPQAADQKGQELLSTVKRLTDSRGSISRRNDEIGQLMSAFDDLSSSLHDATNSVWRIAHLDGLTGLANRRLIMERLHRVIETTTSKSHFAVLFIDLDDFKKVNDQQGHDAGDQLLTEVASRLRSTVGPDLWVVGSEDDGGHHTIARIGGDEFVVLMTIGEDADRANELAANIVNSVAAPYRIGGEKCTIGACVGVAIFPEDADTIDGILANADVAMYQAKNSGKNTWRRYVSDAHGATNSNQG